MKKSLLFLGLLAFCQSIFAQTLDDVKNLIGKNDYENAKTSIDKYLTDTKNAAKADGWYYKGVIYNEVSKKNAACTNCKWEAFEAFKKYQAIDPKNVFMVLEQNVRLFDLYNGFFDLGAKGFNDKNYDKAFESFKNAGLVEDYIKSKGFSYNGFSFGKIDTSLETNIALAARLAKKDADAVIHYQKLADLELNGPDHLEMYQYLAEQYAENKNISAFNAIIAKGKKLYPENDYWIEKELDLIDSKDKPALLAKYEEILKTNTNSYPLAYNYSVELFNYTFLTDPKPTDYNALKTKVKAAIANAIKVNNTADANLLMAKVLYNDTYDLQEELNQIKGAKPDDVKRRADKKTAMLKVADECITYAESAATLYSKMENLKTGQKNNYKNCYSLLEGVYGAKGNAAKVAEAKKKGEAIK